MIENENNPTRPEATMTTSTATQFQILGSEYFGHLGRYRLDTCIDRFGEPVFFVTDAQTLDELGLPSVVAQTGTREDALRKAADALVQGYLENK